MRKDTLTGRSFSDGFLEPFRQFDSPLAGDPTADGLIDQVAQQGGHAAVGSLMHFLTDYTDLDLSSQSSLIQDYISTQPHLFDFVDQELYRKGISFFWKHHRLISLLLGTYSLPYCYAGAHGAQVLWLSERIRFNTRQRLEETGAFVFGIMQEKDWENGLNLIRVAKIRLLHAAVRWYTLHSGRWDTNWGLPVCQEDLAGTNLSFSYIVLKGLRKLSVAMTPAEEHAYLHFWNGIGLLLGLHPDLTPTNRLEAFRLDQRIARRQFRPSEAGKGLTLALLHAFESELSPPTLSRIAAAQMRYFLGDAVADLLDIPTVSWEESLVKAALQIPVFPQLLAFQKPSSPILERYWR